MNTPIKVIYSYMKHTNVPSYRTALAYGCHLVDEYEDDTNGFIKVYAISRDKWIELQKYEII